jgi:transcriptional regulator with XRE-family HTH domain
VVLVDTSVWIDVEHRIAPADGRIRDLRQASGLRASQVARAAGMARSNYARLEAGRHEPGVATLARAAAALRVPLAALLRA